MENNEKLEYLEKFKIIKEKILNEIKNYQDKIRHLNEALEEINITLCKANGHTFTMWEEKENLFLDRDYYYERECTVCGKKEQITTEPNEYCYMFAGKKYVKKK